MGDLIVEIIGSGEEGRITKVLWSGQYWVLKDFFGFSKYAEKDAEKKAIMQTEWAQMHLNQKNEPILTEEILMSGLKKMKEMNQMDPLFQSIDESFFEEPIPTNPYLPITKTGAKQIKMPYVNGKTLKEWTHEYHSLDERKQMAKNLIAVARTLVSQHGDLGNSENWLIRDDGSLVLIDPHPRSENRDQFEIFSAVMIALREPEVEVAPPPPTKKKKSRIFE